MQARLDGFAMTLEMVEGGISDSDASAGVHDSIATAILDLRSQVAKLEQAVNAASHSSPAVDEAQPPHPPDAGQGPNASGSLAVLQIKVGAGGNSVGLVEPGGIRIAGCTCSYSVRRPPRHCEALP
ncbi:hypothetical protein HaLaN_29625, partial [Haematococcus lacustris]